MLISTIDNVLFGQIKCDQSLNVTFDGFVEHLCKILDSCKRSELHLTLIRQMQSTEQVLQFYEKRSFRNLVHLCLPVEEPPLRFILHSINQTLATVQVYTYESLPNFDNIYNIFFFSASIEYAQPTCK